MMIRGLLIAVSALATAAATSAEPVKPIKQEADHPTVRPFILASAGTPKTSLDLAGNRADQAKPARVARVTTCRCGDAATPQDEGEQ